MMMNATVRSIAARDFLKIVILLELQQKKFFCDPLEDKIVYHSEYKVVVCFAQLPTSTSSRSSISGLSTKRLTSTLHDIIYYFFNFSLSFEFFWIKADSYVFIIMSAFFFTDGTKISFLNKNGVTRFDH
jgi:hypothetical protein